MLFFVARRLLSGVALIWVISTFTFFLLSFRAADAARRLAGAQASQEQVDDVAASLGLTRPVVVQYFDWLGGAVRGDFGASWFTSQEVSRTISQTLPVSLSLIVSATILTAIVAVLLGVLAAVRGGWIDKAVQATSILGFAIPAFLVGMVLAFIFAVQLGWFPAIGFTPASESVSGWLLSITLPVLALSIGAVGAVAAQTRGAMIDVMRQDYIRTLRSRGTPVSKLLLVHALRNAAPASVTVLGIQFVTLIGGAVVIEKVFGLRGLGDQLTSASTQGDQPVVLGLVAVVVVIVVIVNLLVDLALGWLNPKVRVA